MDFLTSGSKWWLLVSGAIIIAAVVLSGWQNRIDSCERGASNNTSNIRGWRQAQQRAQHAADLASTPGERAFQQSAADAYNATIADLYSRSSLNPNYDCAKITRPWPLS